MHLFFSQTSIVDTLSVILIFSVQMHTLSKCNSVGFRIEQTNVLKFMCIVVLISFFLQSDRHDFNGTAVQDIHLRREYTPDVDVDASSNQFFPFDKLIKVLCLVEPSSRIHLSLVQLLYHILDDERFSGESFSILRALDTPDTEVGRLLSKRLWEILSFRICYQFSFPLSFGSAIH